MAKTKELKKRYGAIENRFSSVLEAVSRVSGSPFSAVGCWQMGGREAGPVRAMDTPAYMLLKYVPSKVV